MFDLWCDFVFGAAPVTRGQLGNLGAGPWSDRFRPPGPDPMGPPNMTPAVERDIKEVLGANNARQREKIARGETPDYDPSEPLPKHGSYQNYP